MKKLYKQLTAFFLLASGLFLFAFVFSPPSKIEDGLYGNIDKMQRLKSLSSPKVVVVGGSNVSFGIDSEMMTDTLKMPVTNMGIHAGVGLKYMIEQVLPYIKEGDLVILSPEHSQFADMYHGSDELLKLARDVMPKGSKKLSLEDYYHLADELPTYVGTKCMAFLSFWLPAPKLKSAVYTRAQFNEYGDVVAHFGFPRKSIGTKTLRYQLDEKVILELNRYVGVMEQKGAQVLFSPPALQQTCYEHSADLMKDFNEYLQSEQATFHMMGEQKDYVFADTLFFDTVYHLTEEGRKLRTERLCNDVLHTLTQLD